jgi:hypothetical protein
MGGGGMGLIGFLPAPLPEISAIVPSLDRNRFPSWANAKLPYRAWELLQCRMYHTLSQELTKNYISHIHCKKVDGKLRQPDRM